MAKQASLPQDLPLDPVQTYSPPTQTFRFARRAGREGEGGPRPDSDDPQLSAPCFSVWALSDGSAEASPDDEPILGLAPTAAVDAGSDATLAEGANKTSPDAPLPPPPPPLATAPLGAAPLFAMVRCIAVGGCGEIWEARQGSLGRLVAVKRIRADFRSRGEGSDETKRRFAEAMFRQEAVTTALLEHPNIVPIHDLGVDAKGRPLLAMKLVRGEHWHRRIHEDFDKMSVPDFLGRHLPILVDVGQAVAFAHSRGIVHRDLKPAQVMTGEFGETLLMDWGLAVAYDPAMAHPEVGDPAERPVDGALPTLESASSPAGTPCLMAPEQTAPDARGVGPWTDVYLLGGTLYYLLTGTYPHQKTTSTEAMRSAISGHIDPPEGRARGREVPAELRRLCLKALEKEPRDRIPSAQTFVGQLKDYLSGATQRRQSEELAAEVTAELGQVERWSYDEISDRLSTLGRARGLWSDNPQLQPLADCLLVAFTERALEHDDLTLARLQAERVRDDAQRDGLLTRIVAGEAHQAAQRRQRRLALFATLIFFVVILLGGSLVGWRITSDNNERSLAFRQQKSLLDEMGERVKELRCIYGVSDAIQAADDLDEIFAATASLLPAAWMHPDIATARVSYDERDFTAPPDFREGPWRQAAEITVFGEFRGFVEVFYLEERPEADEGPFLREERKLIDRIARLLSAAAERRESEAILRKEVLRLQTEASTGSTE